MANWFVKKDGKNHGPFSDQQLKSLAISGKLKPEDLVRREDKASWKEAQHIQGLYPETLVTSASVPIPQATTENSSIVVEPQQKKSFLRKVLQYSGAVLLFLLVIGFLQDNGYLGSSLKSFKSDNLKLSYTPNVTSQEAEQLWDFIKRTWTSNKDQKNFQITKTGSTYQLKMGLTNPEVILSSQKHIPALQLVGWAISREVFNNSPVEIHLCDLELNTLEVIPFRDDKNLYNDVQASVSQSIENPVDSRNSYLSFSFGKLYYTPKTTQQEAARLWGYLSKNGFFDGTGVGDCQLTKTNTDSTYIFRICVLDGQAERDTFGNVMRQTCSLISQNVFNGASVDIHACDSSFNTIKVFTESY